MSATVSPWGPRRSTEQRAAAGAVEELLGAGAAARDDLLHAGSDLALGGDATELLAERPVEQRVVGDDAVERRRALLAGDDEAGFAERGEVAGDPGLSGARDFGQLADGQLFLQQRCEEQHAGLIGQGLEAFEPRNHRRKSV